MKKILFIDDSETLQMIVKDIGALNKTKMDQAIDAASAMAMMSFQSYDIVFCDQRLPDMNGVDLLYILSEKYPSTDFYLMSNFSKDSLKEDLGNLKIKGFIDKYSLVEKMDEVLGG